MTEATASAAPTVTGWLQPRGVLLHIGPHKTGTTAIQGALADARPALERRGIIYPGGAANQQRLAALAITSSKGAVTGHRRAQRLDWEQLVSDVHAARRRRVVVSAEAFANATKASATEITTDLGSDRVRVVITLRPLAKILPSAWQQSVQSRLTLRYDDWLKLVLDEMDDRRARNFWHRHRHDVLVERWTSVVGADRVAVVVVEDRNRLALPRGFEQLLGLPEGFLVIPETSDNRGLLAQEIELIRRLNETFDANRWHDDLYIRMVRHGVVHGMQRRNPEPNEPRITTPAWAVERANEMAGAATARIRTSGALVLGHLDTLSAVPVPEPTEIPPDLDELVAAARDVALAGAREHAAQIVTPPPLEATARPIEQVPTGELVGIVGERLGRRVRSTLGLGIRRY